MTVDVTPFLMFTGRAEEALSFYTSLFPASEVSDLTRHGAGGEILMPLDEYPFSRRFGWVSDRFGVSWQISVSPAEQDA